MRGRNERSFCPYLIFGPLRKRKRRVPSCFSGCDHLLLNGGTSGFRSYHHLMRQMQEVWFQTWRNWSEDGYLCFIQRRYGSDSLESRISKQWKLQESSVNSHRLLMFCSRTMWRLVLWDPQQIAVVLGFWCGATEVDLQGQHHGGTRIDLQG